MTCLLSFIYLFWIPTEIIHYTPKQLTVFSDQSFCSTYKSYVFFLPSKKDKGSNEVNATWPSNRRYVETGNLPEDNEWSPSSAENSWGESRTQHPFTSFELVQEMLISSRLFACLPFIRTALFTLCIFRATTLEVLLIVSKEKGEERTEIVMGPSSE